MRWDGVVVVGVDVSGADAVGYVGDAGGVAEVT